MREQIETLGRLLAASHGAPILQATVDVMGGFELKTYDSGMGLMAPRFGDMDFLAQADASSALAEAMQESGDDRPVTLEVRTGAAGQQVTWTREVPALDPAVLVLDPDYRNPGHPVPPMPQPAAARFRDEPTDPAVLARMRALVDEFRALVEAATGRAVELGDGLSEEEILAAERRMNLRLPEDLRALYGLVSEAGADPFDDDAEDDGLLGPWQLVGLEWSAETFAESGPGSRGGYADDVFATHPVVLDPHPAGHVRRVSRDDWWFSFANDGAHGWLFADLDPAEHGTSGQLVTFGHDSGGDPLGYVAPSVPALIEQVLERRRSGTRNTVGREIPGGEDAGGQRHTAYRLPEVGLPGTPNLRVLEFMDCGRVTGTAAHGVPLESVTFRRTPVPDLAVFAGHPTLWRLVLAEVPGPVSIAPLPQVPELSFLDLSGAEVTDLELLAKLPKLRVLVLSRAQWTRLDAVPAGLAAAAMTGRVPLDDVLDWVGRMRG